MDLLQQNPSLAPKPAGGLPNMGYTTDRLGNIIRAPMAIPVFARGGDVDTNELMQRVNEYNMYGDDPAYYSESRNMLNALPVDETTYSESPSKIQVKRVRGQELRPKSSEGFGKGMAMEVESLTTSKGASPKALKGTAKDDFMELARTYKLKAKEAENMAKGLSRDTFNAPTLERPTLTKGSLTKRRFEKGGEVKKSVKESEKETPSVFQVSDYATEASRRMFPSQLGQDDQRDAARHMLAAASLARRYGPKAAELLGKAHEYTSNPNTFFSVLGIGEPREDLPYDLHNNRVGIDLGSRATSQADLERLVAETAKQATFQQTQGKPWIMSPEQIKARRDAALKKQADLQKTPEGYKKGGPVDTSTAKGQLVKLKAA